MCLSESEEVVGAGWLHHESEAKDVADKKAADCVVSACLPCIKTYFEVLHVHGRVLRRERHSGIYFLAKYSIIIR